MRTTCEPSNMRSLLPKSEVIEVKAECRHRKFGPVLRWSVVIKLSSILVLSWCTGAKFAMKLLQGFEEIVGKCSKTVVISLILCPSPDWLIFPSSSVIQVRNYWTPWRTRGTSSSVMSCPCCRPSSILYRYTHTNTHIRAYIPLGKLWVDVCASLG